MDKPKSIKELLSIGGSRLSALKARSEARNTVVEHVRAALPSQFCESIFSAGVENGLLTVGVTGANWAARLRYVTEDLRNKVGASMGVNIASVRIKVVPPTAPPTVTPSRP
jgi:hypothetical protein